MLKRLLAAVFVFLVFFCAAPMRLNASAAERTGVVIVHMDGPLFDASGSFRLNKAALSMAPDTTRSITASLQNEDVTANVLWTTSNKSVASVKGGKISAHHFGTCVITAKTREGQHSSCTIHVNPPKVSLSSVKKRSAGKVCVTWKNTPDVSGYQVYRATSEKGTYSKVKTVNGAKITSFTNTVTRKKKYFYKVRAFYKGKNGVYIYGPWSGIKSISM